MKRKWKLVPVEPTPEMIECGNREVINETAREVWEAMLDAAPPAVNQQPIAYWWNDLSEGGSLRRRVAFESDVPTYIANRGLHPLYDLPPDAEKIAEEYCKAYADEWQGTLGEYIAIIAQFRTCVSMLLDRIDYRKDKVAPRGPICVLIPPSVLEAIDDVLRKSKP